MNTNVIRRFLKSKTLEELELQQLKLNKLYSTSFEYSSFYFVKGNWYTDFLIDAEISQRILSQMRGIK